MVVPYILLSMRFPLVLALLAAALPGLAQNAASSQQVTGRAPIELPLFTSISLLPQWLRPDDSLQRRVYQRNRVRTVTLLQLRSTGPADTVDYTELDRRGNVLLYRPKFGQTYRQRYNRRQQLLERTTYPTSDSGVFFQVTYDPATKATTTCVGPSLAQLTKMQVVRPFQHGDTSGVEAFGYHVSSLPSQLASRLLRRTYWVGADTMRNDFTAYDAGQRVLQAEFYYTVGDRRRPHETGQVFGQPGQRQAASRYLPTHRNTYDSQGNLVRSVLLPLPSELTEKPSTQVSADGRTTMHVSAITDSSSVRYVRNAEGLLLREEFWMTTANPFATSPAPAKRTLSFTAYTYLPNGLRQTKFGSLSARYEYRYTYY